MAVRVVQTLYGKSFLFASALTVLSLSLSFLFFYFCYCCILLLFLASKRHASYSHGRLGEDRKAFCNYIFVIQLQLQQDSVYFWPKVASIDFPLLFLWLPQPRWFFFQFFLLASSMWVSFVRAGEKFVFIRVFRFLITFLHRQMHSVPPVPVSHPDRTPLGGQRYTHTHTHTQKTNARLQAETKITFV